MYRNFTRENREAPLPSAAARWEKAISHKIHMNGNGESYSSILPAKLPNEGQGGPQEVAGGRLLTRENAEQLHPCRTQSRESGPSGLDRVRPAAKRDK